MILTNEDLLAISQVVETKLDVKLNSELSPMKRDIETLKNDVHNIKLFQENVILPRLNTIESCYLDTYRRYQQNNDKMETAFDDIALLKNVVADHSEKLQKLA